MKSAVSLLGCVVRFIGQRVLPVSFIGMLVLGISFAHAQTVPPAISYVYTQAGRSSNANAVSFNSEVDVVYENSQGDASYAADSKISVSFGTNAPVAITGQAFATTGQLYAQAFASAGANLRFYFRVVQVGNPPWQPSFIPILFEASGHGEVLRGYGMFDASAFVGYVPAGFPSNLFKIHWEGGPHNASFGQPVTLDLPINDQYQVLLGATAVASSAFNLTNESNVLVYVDPIIRFDQDTFNARYPQNSFSLSDYYTLEVSSNLSMNRPPVADANGPYSIGMGGTLNLDGSASYDPDEAYGDRIISYEWDINNDGSYEYTGVNPTIPWQDLQSIPREVAIPIALRITDSFGSVGIDVSSLIIIRDLNRPPILDPIGDKTVDEGQLLEFVITATDPEGTRLTYSASNLPTGAIFDTGTGRFSWIPDFAQAGNFSVVFTATDRGTPPMSISETITITVGNVNRPPILDPIGSRTVNEEQLLTITITATDPDRDALTYSASNLPSGATFDPVSRTFTWVPNYDQAGNYSVRFTVTDNVASPESDTEEITITVGNVNQPPVLAPIGNKTVKEGELLEFTITATDPDGNALTYSANNLPPGAAFDPIAQKFRWTPTHDQAGTYSNIEFTVTDNGNPNELDFEVIEITVGNVNRAPVFTPVGTQSVSENQLLQFYVTATDPDGNAFTYSTGPLPNGASFDASSRLFSWRPDSTQAGTYTVTFYAADSGSPPMTGHLDVVINVGDVLTPCQLADQIIQTVLGLNLRKSVENSYLAHLKKVCKFVEDGKMIRAIVQLDTFIVKVIIDIVKGNIGGAAGRDLINMAISLINVIKS